MDRVNLRRITWALHRSHLRYGALMWASMAVGLIVVALVVGVVTSTMRLSKIEHDLATVRKGLAQTGKVTVMAIDEGGSLPLPAEDRRFEITQRVLEELQKGSLPTPQIRFKFESVAETGVIREVAVFSVRASWEDIADLLARLQATDRAVYIARLKVSRDNAEDAVVDADIQLVVAMLAERTDAQVVR